MSARVPAPALSVDRVEVTIARAEIEAGAEDLDRALAITDPRERREVVKTMVAHFALAARALDTIVERREEPARPAPKTRRP